MTRLWPLHGFCLLLAAWSLLLVKIAAAVADEGLAGNHLRVVADDESDEVGEVFRLDPLLDRLVAHHPVKSVFRVVGAGALGSDHARHDSVDIYPLLAELAGEAPGE